MSKINHFLLLSIVITTYCRSPAQFKQSPESFITKANSFIEHYNIFYDHSEHSPRLSSVSVFLTETPEKPAAKNKFIFFIIIITLAKLVLLIVFCYGIAATYRKVRSLFKKEQEVQDEDIPTRSFVQDSASEYSVPDDLNNSFISTDGSAFKKIPNHFSDNAQVNWLACFNEQQIEKQFPGFSLLSKEEKNQVIKQKINL